MDWLKEVTEKINKKMKSESARVGGDFIPYTPINGKYEQEFGGHTIYWWTNGFWGGILWQMYAATKDEQYKIMAEKVEKKLDEALYGFEGLHHDVGFMWLHTAVANYRLTGNAESKRRGLIAANVLAGRYNPNGKFIRAWNMDRTGWMIVDCMMNIPLLYWASDVTGDPRFKAIAMNHADTTMRYTVRDDGSCNHIIILDPNTGEFVDNPAGQGYESGSSWSRGQSWALYGFALSYHYTKKPEYLSTCKRIANYFIANVCSSGYVPLVDFRQPPEPVLYDTTAGTIAACGLLALSDVLPTYEGTMYKTAALNILQSIDQKHCNWDPDYDSIVQNGTGSYHTTMNDIHIPIIYGDYFFIEAVNRLNKVDFLIW